MTRPRILIDTNVFISLEDQRQISPVVAELVRKSAEFGLHLCVHDAAIQDIARDTDAQRRAVSLSKLAKFPRITRPKLPSLDALEGRFGSIRSDNDAVDVELLHTLAIGVVGFLVTEDQGIHTRARHAGLGDRVFTVADAVLWIKRQYEPISVFLPMVEERKAHQLDLSDEMFVSLREGYPNFEEWWWRTCVPQHRDCWIVTINGKLAALAVRKEEEPWEAKVETPSRRILKICTFKVREEYRGEKLGELILKQVLWYAQRNDFDLVYFTTKPNQSALINVAEYFGFKQTSVDKSGEVYLEKAISTAKLNITDMANAFQLVRQNYPRFSMEPPVEAYYVPIRPSYHRKLFPELISPRNLPLFPEENFKIRITGDRTPGNTIRKVYLCKSPLRSLRPGDVLLFYHSKTTESGASQSVTTAGIVEAVSESSSWEDLSLKTAKRSVFSELELKSRIEAGSGPVKIIDFLLAGHFSPPIPLAKLIEYGAVRGRPPQSICKISRSATQRIRHHIDWGFEV